jgi:general secretion pathway protein M
MKPFSPMGRRILALLLLVGVIAIPYVFIVEPLAAKHREYADTIAQDQDLLRRYRRIAADRPLLQARREQLQRDPISQGAYLSGESEALVAANLQNRIKTVIEANGGSLASTQILQSSDEDGFRVVTIRVRMTADIDAASKTFYALEAGQPYLFIDSVDISSRQARRRRRRDQKTAPENVDLNINFDVSGYMRPT